MSANSVSIVANWHSTVNTAKGSVVHRASIRRDFKPSRNKFISRGLKIVTRCVYIGVGLTSEFSGPDAELQNCAV